MSSSNQKDEISIKELLHTLSEYKTYLLSKWKLIVMVSCIGALLGLAYAFLSKKLYQAQLTFAIEDNSSQLGSYAMIASQFGMNIGAGGEGGAFSGDNIIELMKSRLLIETSLLTPVTVDGKKDLLINRYIEFNELRTEWEDNPKLINLKYNIGQLRSQYSLEQDSVLNKVYEKILKKDLTVEKLDKQLNIVKVEVLSRDELFAKYFTEILAKNVSDFYIETKTKKSRANVMLLQNKVDSVKYALDEEMFSAAINQDQNQNPILARARIPQVKRQMNLQILTTMYGELIKNLELAKLTLMKEEPLIQVIDSPILPLEYKKPGKKNFLIFGGILAGFLCVTYLIVKKSYQSILDSK